MFGLFKKNKLSQFQENYDFLQSYPKEMRLKVAKALKNEVNPIIENKGNIKEVMRYLTIASDQKKLIPAGIAARENPNWLMAELKCNICELIIAGEWVPAQSAINAMNILFGWIEFAEKT